MKKLTLLLLTLILAGCQPTTASPDAETPRTSSKPVVELLEASGEGRARLRINDQEVSVVLTSEKATEGVCTRVSFGWGPLQLGGLEHGACGSEKSAPGPASPEADATDASDGDQ